MVKMPKIAVNGIEINYHEEGTSYPLILIHGLSDDSTLWIPLMSEFSEYYRTIALDVRGHGYSGKLITPLNK